MPDERAILLQLYDAAGGPHWRAKQRWLKGPNACRWHGIECDGDGFVTSIDLGGNGVRGALPDALSTLARLRTLNIDESRLSGTLPPLSHLHSLKVLLLASNPALSGTLPPHATLNNLEELDLSRTRVSGTIGSATGQLRALRRLQLNHAAISGTVPSQIGMLARAEAIFAHESTALSGTLPSEIGRLAPTLRLGMSLASTRLSGSIPSQLGGLSRLRALWLVHTRLSGTLPPSIGAMRSLAELELHANRISGALPTQLGALRPTLRRCVRAVARIRTLSSPLLSACRSHHVCALRVTAPRPRYRCSPPRRGHTRPSTRCVPPTRPSRTPTALIARCPRSCPRRANLTSSAPPPRRRHEGARAAPILARCIRGGCGAGAGVRVEARRENASPR